MERSIIRLVFANDLDTGFNACYEKMQEVVDKMKCEGVTEDDTKALMKQLDDLHDESLGSKHDHDEIPEDIELAGKVDEMHTEFLKNGITDEQIQDFVEKLNQFPVALDSMDDEFPNSGPESSPTIKYVSDVLAASDDYAPGVEAE